MKGYTKNKDGIAPLLSNGYLSASSCDIGANNFLEMVQPYSVTADAAITTPTRATFGHLQQVQQGSQGSCNNHNKAQKTPMVTTKDLMASTKAQLLEQSFPLKMQTLIGRGKKLHKLYASKSQYSSGRAANLKGHLERSTIISRSTDSSLIRQSLIGATFDDRDPFNLVRHFPSSSNHGFPPSPVHGDDVGNDGDDTDNDDNDDASFSEDDAISSSEDEDLYIPQCAHAFNRALRDLSLKQLKADLKRYNITKLGRSLRQALDHVPSGLDRHEWEWLVKEIYSKDALRKPSIRNSTNRAYYKKDRLHRIGSRPYQQVAWELVI
ncbi:hypothetical protein Cgig2_028262 [Carnegiea gigantea]|uniref:Uncharacterized protein n=1 Tax=Carnegiea gigantea TaxID=171969 RepID=A0A9Q1GMF6_9CARY|nr:hypothetical protein Cgig2_028262 [Carnegiea gigantea]